MKDAKVTRLAAKAVELKKAWVMGVAIIGKPDSVHPSELDVPGYDHWQAKPLKRHIADLEQDLDELGKRFLLMDWSPTRRNKAVPWLSQKYDEWLAAKQPIYELGRVHEVEQSIGRLGHRRRIECPPYAQVLMQGFSGAAIRHPEYHLAKDLALLCNLFLDAEATAEEHLRNRRMHSNEISQSLARSVILTCYNLLESFVSGLAAAFIIENPTAPEDTLKMLQKPKDRTLKARFEEVPALVTGMPNPMAPYRSILTPLFGDYQKRRNAFVHCEPGPVTPKEGFFHETDAKIVRVTVSLTIRAIRAAWKVVHETEGPRWLPDPDPKGRFLNVAANLTETSSHHIKPC